jgi:hypothetical protein
VILPTAVVTILGANPNLNNDLDNGNLVWGQECGVWVEVVLQITVDRPHLVILDQDDCLRTGHVVSAEEDELFDLGRGAGAEVVVYYLASDVAGFRGCAAHPPGRRGCWVGDSATDWTFIHELTHVVGGNPHVTDTDNLMISNTGTITNAPPDLTSDQCVRILRDPALLDVSSIVLNL